MPVTTSTTSSASRASRSPARGSPLTIRAIIAWREALEDERILLRDVIDLDATYGGGPEAQTDNSGTDNSADGANRVNGTDVANAKANGAAKTDGDSDDSNDDDEDGDDDANNLSLAAMEAKLKPEVLELFDEIARTYKKLRKLQEQRLAGLK